VISGKITESTKSSNRKWFTDGIGIVVNILAWGDHLVCKVMFTKSCCLIYFHDVGGLLHTAKMFNSLWACFDFETASNIFDVFAVVVS